MVWGLISGKKWWQGVILTFLVSAPVLASESCLEMARELWKNVPSLEQPGLSKFSYSARLSHLHFLSWWAGDSRPLAIKWAKLVNQARDENLIGSADVEKLVAALHQKGRFFAQLDAEGKVLVQSVESVQKKNEGLWKDFFSTSRWQIPETSRAKILQFFRERDFFPQEIEILMGDLKNQRPSTAQVDQLLEYLDYLQSFTALKRWDALQKAHLLWGTSEEQNSVVIIDNFFRWQKKFDSFEVKKQKKIQQELQLNGTANAYQQSLELAAEERRIYQKLAY
ncbi:MAG: hypothetical protein WCG27_04020, partial [Pseudomonadota bacterium]